MKALQFTVLNHPELVDLPIPIPAPDEVLIRVGAVGICHTDLEILRGHYPAEFLVTPGHEFAGDVVEIGSAVDRSWLHRAVAVDPLINCRQCAWCRAGRTNLCQALQAYGAEINGGQRNSSSSGPLISSTPAVSRSPWPPWPSRWPAPRTEPNAQR